MNIDINFFERLDQRIRQGKTGGLKELADYMGVSAATLSRSLNKLRDEANCPLVFDKGANTYRYTQMGNLSISFTFTPLSDEGLGQITGGTNYTQYFDEFF